VNKVTKRIRGRGREKCRRISFEELEIVEEGVETSWLPVSGARTLESALVLLLSKLSAEKRSNLLDKLRTLEHPSRHRDIRCPMLSYTYRKPNTSHDTFYLQVRVQSLSRSLELNNPRRSGDRRSSKVDVVSSRIANEVGEMKAKEVRGMCASAGKREA
jgi:hypothetical protein